MSVENNNFQEVGNNIPELLARRDNLQKQSNECLNWENSGSKLDKMEDMMSLLASKSEITPGIKEQELQWEYHFALECRSFEEQKTFDIANYFQSVFTQQTV